MRASDYQLGEFENALLSARKQRNWLWLGLVGSLALHLILCFYFYRTRFAPGESMTAETQPVPMFKVRTVDLSPQVEKNSVDQTNPAAKPNPDNAEEQFPDEKKSFDKLLQDVQASAAMPDDMSNVLPEQPKVEQPDMTSFMNEIEHSSSQTLTNNPNATREQSLLNEKAVSGRPQPALSGTELATSTAIKKPNTFTSKMPGDSAGPSKDRPKGFSDLDQLLKQTGPLGSGTQIRMPDDQLFAFDSADLQPSETLQKLVTLLKRNPKATFTIEGYTDSIGTPEYNFDLSQRRAESVRDYLVGVLGVDPVQVRARGYGASKFLVRPQSVPLVASPDLDSEINRQRLNRRVVVVIEANE